MIELQTLKQKRPTVVVGAAFCDIMLGLDSLPCSGGDVTAEELDSQVGGCAFNVLRALSRLTISSVNAIPVGNGSRGKTVEAAMAQEGLSAVLHHPTHDNGWCLAMVEAGRERTFITIEGCEQHWSKPLLDQITVPANAIIYVSGYELVGSGSEALREWLLAQEDDKTIFVDFGPRLADIDKAFIEKLITKHPILTVNRDEIKALCRYMGLSSGQDGLSEAVSFSNDHGISLICRFDHEGATICKPGKTPVAIPAYKVDVVDSIAAGDSHAAGVIAGLACNMTLSQSVKLGNMVAAIVVSRPGSNGAPRLDEVRQFQASKV